MSNRVRVSALVITALLASSIPAFGHDVQTVGPYTLAIGWRQEPTYVDQPNAVQVFVSDANEQALDDLAAGDLIVTVSYGDQTSPPLVLEPTWETSQGMATGEYTAEMMPTAVGDYVFHVTGTVHDQAVDVTSTSGTESFDPVIGPSGIQFPDKVPTLGELASRLAELEVLVRGSTTPEVTPAP
jgi:hypothetical protein